MSGMTRITLLAPLTAAGRDYPKGAVLALPARSAEWLIGLQRAEPAAASAAVSEATPAAPDTAAPPCADCEHPTKSTKRSSKE